ncbi:MAG TPA: tetratricopeptide repeat protein, partial [Anaeromyxobacteraceae bacterium]|nr:tetratricopeptide repeat protein [Anaeromyxobacteraceae bacterium]
RGDLGGAYAVVQAVLRDDPTDAEALAVRGTVLREQGMLVEAEADLREAVQRAPDLASAHASLAILYDLLGRADDAEEHHRAAIERDPRNPRYLNNLAFSLFARGKAREAIPLYLEAVRHDPANPRLRNNLGFAYAVAGDWPRAKRQFDSVGSPSDARLNLGYAYEKAGRLPQAIALYEEAVRLDPESTYARESLARVASRLGTPSPNTEQAGAKTPGEGGP